MSAADALLLGEEPSALVFDLGAAREGLRAYVGGRAPVLAYLEALRGVQLGERAIRVGGADAGHFDPLGKRPAAAQRLARAKANGERLSSYLDSLHAWGGGAFVPWVSLILPQLETVKAVLEAIPSGGQATPGQATQVIDAIGLATGYTQLIGYATESMRAGVTEFLGHLAEDHEALAGGETAVAAIAAQVQEDTRNAALPLLLPPYQGIGQAILQIGAALAGEVSRLAAQVDKAVSGHREIGGGISALASAVETLGGKYAAAHKAVARAAAADLPQVVRKLEPAKAIQSWREFLQFLERSGL